MEFNKHIDFSSIFNDLYEEHKEIMDHEKYIADHYKKIIDFVEEGGFNAFELLKDESEFTDDKIFFTFSQDLGGANESTNVTDTIDYFIVYDRLLGEFTSCEN